MGLLFVRFIGFLEDNQNRARFLTQKKSYHTTEIMLMFFFFKHTQTLFALATSSRGAIKIPCSIVVQVSTALLNNLVQKSMGANFFYSTS